MRKIPSIMVSQHPDNANKPYWHTNAYISDQYEVKECFLAFSKLNVDEYKWDWEGKFVDESVFERMVSEYPSFFKKNPLGREKFLTFRLPDFRVKTEFRLGRAFMALISAAGLAKQINFSTPPMFEVILPMTKTAEEIISIQEAFREISQLKHPLFHGKNGIIKHIEVIPLFEDTKTIMDSDQILGEYLSLHKQKFGFKPSYIRPYLARSDSALTAGIIPSVLAIKIALSKYADFEEKTGIKLFPILGAGSLPFRGGSTPYTIDSFTDEYRGIRTMLAQSAFQYDYPFEDVVKAVKKIHTILHKKARKISEKEERRLKKIVLTYDAFYKTVVKEIAPIIYSVATFLPPRRERLKHTGLLKYPRTLMGVKIPRAIGFTASLYSLGIPPELIGTGRAIKKAKADGDLNLIEKHYVNLKEDLRRAGKYLNKKNLKTLTKKYPILTSVLEDVKAIEDYLGEDLGPKEPNENAHKVLTSAIYDYFMNSISITELIQEASTFRRSLG